MSKRMLPRSFRGPRLFSAGFRASEGKVTMSVCFVYLDEFGHIGPFMNRTAAKYNESPVFGQTPARHMLSPPFEVESYINQNIQAADWVAAIVGRLWAYETLPNQYADHLPFKNYFWQRLQQVSTHSTVLPR